MQNDIHITPRDPAVADPSGPGAPVNRTRGVSDAADPSLGDLFKQLAQDSAVLVRQEVALAKAEVAENVRGFARGAALLAAGGAVLLLAMFALTAFLIVLLGDALNNYWLGALVVTVLYAVVGGALVMAGRNKLQENELKPERTIETLRDDKRWAQAEIEQVKQGLQS
jgi:uncharacterized membrane protein YqjE